MTSSADRPDAPDSASPATRVERATWHLGRVVLGLGVLTLLFAGHQLWFTDLLQERAQASLRAEFVASTDRAADAEPGVGSTAESAPSEDLVHYRPRRETDRSVAGSRIDAPPAQPIAMPTVSTTDREPDSARVASGGQVASAAPPGVAPDPPARGTPIAQLLIPKIGVDQIVIEGTDREQLARGPGHYVGTALPGQPGNASFAGHRTTYGAPFSRLDELALGDQIIVRPSDGSELVYQVTDRFIVAPGRSDVVADHGDDRLTLTTCTPKGSATSRLIVVAHPSVESAAGQRSVATRQEDAVGAPFVGQRSVAVRDDVEEAPFVGQRSVAVRDYEAEQTPFVGQRSVAVRDDAAPAAALLTGDSLAGAPSWVDSPVDPWLPTIVWSASLVLVLALGRSLCRRTRWWIGGAVAAPLSAVVLNLLFVNVELLLPASF